MSLTRAFTHTLPRSFQITRGSASIQRCARCLSTQHLIYCNPRRLRSLGLTALAGGQATFWAYAAYLSHTAPEPVISSAWTFGGFGLSAAFAGLIATYLRRSVSQLALVDVQGGVGVEVQTHGLLGGRGKEEGLVILARELVGGVAKRDDRYWTFARIGERVRLYYIVDRERGVMDSEGVEAVVGGGEMLMVLMHKRNAGRMRKRWNEWKEGTHG